MKLYSNTVHVTQAILNEKDLVFLEYSFQIKEFITAHMKNQIGFLSVCLLSIFGFDSAATQSTEPAQHFNLPSQINVFG